MVLSCCHFKTKPSLQYWLHRSSKIAAYSNRNNSPGTICTVYNSFFSYIPIIVFFFLMDFFPTIQQSSKKLTIKVNFACVGKKIISRQGKWIYTFLFLSSELFLLCRSCKHVPSQKYPWRVFIPKYLGKSLILMQSF